ncbi:hypothetical protein QEH52_19045 [Coraliomargarita sp. SDUM461003]|uniref:DUF3108 domain-containing protein n=2 Tax=Thalassobacterium maritimum TaxID=3041265 RepID=A0ABU1AZP9_9BACT|nr:hypothetical protein [Coraliomargarita sp. SDUM461003]
MRIYCIILLLISSSDAFSGNASDSSFFENPIVYRTKYQLFEETKLSVEHANTVDKESYTAILGALGAMDIGKSVFNYLVGFGADSLESYAGKYEAQYGATFVSEETELDDPVDYECVFTRTLWYASKDDARKDFKEIDSIDSTIARSEKHASTNEELFAVDAVQLHFRLVFGDSAYRVLPVKVYYSASKAYKARVPLTDKDRLETAFMIQYRYIDTAKNKAIELDPVSFKIKTDIFSNKWRRLDGFSTDWMAVSKSGANGPYSLSMTVVESSDIKEVLESAAEKVRELKIEDE